MFIRIFVILVTGLLCLGGAASAQRPPIEAYGKLPNLRSLAVSPSGERVVFLRREGDIEFVGVFSLAEQKIISAVSTENVKTRSAFFVTDDYVILRVSETTRIFGFRSELEYTGAFSWNVSTNNVRQLLRNDESLFPAQTGLGRIVGRLKGSDHVFMPAFVGPAYAAPDLNLLKVNLETGRGLRHARGRTKTIDWIVGEDGEIIAREDFDDDNDVYSLYFYENGRDVRIYKEKVDIPRLSLIGVKADRSALVVALRPKGADRDVLMAMSRDGKLSAPLFYRADADVDRVLTDANRVVYGVEYSGLKPSYEFFDQRLTSVVAQLQPLFPYASITLSDWTDNFHDMVVYVAGGLNPPAFYLFRPEEKTISKIGSSFEQISAAQLGQVYTIEYKARDGQRISAVLTLPPGADMKERRPTVVLPHGGPASYDSVGFDWLAQFFANRGYAVIQPNFRGSVGFGRAFEVAGHGEWGRGVMQNDVTDAVKAVIAAGISDSDNICIVGASYGGYAALAGGAFTPELYKCVAAIAPVADLRRMIYDERDQNGADSWVVTYWTKAIGDVKAERKKLEQISPSNYASEFRAPVLLIHGDDDTVVPFRQSRIMEKALIDAGKDVEMITVDGGDHWLSTSETRLATLQALDGFLARHLGSGVTGAAP